MGHTVVVTGGCGFIGCHFVRLLYASRPEWRIVNVDKLTYAGNVENLGGIVEGSRYRFEHADIADAVAIDQLIREERPWAIVNFAAESHVDRSILDPAPFLWTNVVGVQVLLHAAQRHRIPRFVQVSTDEVYGDVAAPTLAGEDAPLRPGSPYAASKAAADLLCLAFHRTYDMPVVIVRSTNNYGPFQFPEKLIPLMVRNAVSGEPLPVYGDGGQVRDWLYVEDNCEAIRLVLEQGREGEIYNIGTGTGVTNLEVIRMLSRLLAAEARLDETGLLGLIRYVQDRPGHDRRYALDTRKIRDELGWIPRTPFREGLHSTVQWYLGHADWISRAISQDYHEYYDAVYRQHWSRASQ